MKVIKNISVAVLGIYYALFITRIVLPQFVQIDVSWAVGFLLGTILLYASPFAVLAVILICISLYLSYKREMTKPRVFVVVALVVVSIFPTITTLQFAKSTIQSKQYSSKIEKSKVDLNKKLIGSIILNSVVGERIKEFQVHDNYAYILSAVETFSLSNPTSSSYLNIVDISNPSIPVNKSRTSLASDRNAKLAYSDNKIYVTDVNNTLIVDVLNKENPKIMNLPEPPGVFRSFFFKDDRHMYIVDDTDTPNKKTSYEKALRVIYEMPYGQRWKFDLGEDYPRDIYARDGYFYSFFTDSGSGTYGVSKLSIIDATNQKNIREVKTIDINLDTKSLAKKIAVSGNSMYLQSEVVTSNERGMPLSTVTLITVLDISDVNNINVVGKLEIKEPFASFRGGLDISVSGNSLFFENKIINISDPRNLVIEKELTGFVFPAESVSGGYYYNLVYSQDAARIDIYKLIDVVE